MKNEIKEKSLLLVNNKLTIPNIFELEKLGAGIDGYVFKYRDLALKLLKYDINERKNKNLMTFEKTRYFESELDLKRIIMPIDIMLDEDGVFAGYAMKYLDDVTIDKRKGSPIHKTPGDFSCGDFVHATMEFSEDFEQLNKKKVIPEDINKKSFIYTQSYAYLCDTDKYQISQHDVTMINRDTLNFIIAKLLYWVMLDLEFYDKEDLKHISRWLKKSIHDKEFVSKIIKEIGTDYSTSINEYCRYKVKRIVH